MEEGNVFLQSGGYSNLYWSKEEPKGFWSTSALPLAPKTGIALLQRTIAIRDKKDWCRKGFRCANCKLITFEY